MDNEITESEKNDELPKPEDPISSAEKMEDDFWNFNFENKCINKYLGRPKSAAPPPCSSVEVVEQVEPIVSESNELNKAHPTDEYNNLYQWNGEPLGLQILNRANADKMQNLFNYINAMPTSGEFEGVEKMESNALNGEGKAEGKDGVNELRDPFYKDKALVSREVAEIYRSDISLGTDNWFHLSASALNKGSPILGSVRRSAAQVPMDPKKQEEKKQKRLLAIEDLRELSKQKAKEKLEIRERKKKGGEEKHGKLKSYKHIRPKLGIGGSCIDQLNQLKEGNYSGNSGYWLLPVASNSDHGLAIRSQCEMPYLAFLEAAKSASRRMQQLLAKSSDLKGKSEDQREDAEPDCPPAP